MCVAAADHICRRKPELARERWSLECRTTCSLMSRHESLLGRINKLDERWAMRWQWRSSGCRGAGRCRDLFELERCRRDDRWVG